MIHTPESALRIRVIRLPGPRELEEFELHYLRVGQAYVIPARLASILVLSGIAELVDNSVARAEAAAFGPSRFPKGD